MLRNSWNDATICITIFALMSSDSLYGSSAPNISNSSAAQDDISSATEVGSALQYSYLILNFCGAVLCLSNNTNQIIVNSVSDEKTTISGLLFFVLWVILNVLFWTILHRWGSLGWENYYRNVLVCFPLFALYYVCVLLVKVVPSSRDTFRDIILLLVSSDQEASLWTKKFFRWMCFAFSVIQEILIVIIIVTEL
jgi:hypothetical protein